MPDTNFLRIIIQFKTFGINTKLGGNLDTFSVGGGVNLKTTFFRVGGTSRRWFFYELEI